jgi:hypothetical protein
MEKTQIFINKSIIIHKDKYDYSKVKYIKSKENITIICKIHGEFEQKPTNHLKGCGCKKCAILIMQQKKSLSNIEFINKAKLIHNDRYNYSKVTYIKSNKKVIIICKIHGEFIQTPHNHLNGQNCRKCNTSNTNEFINKAKLIYKDKYDYSKVKYIKSNEKIIIICKIHGEFEQNPNNHLSGFGCNNCGILSMVNKNSLNTNEFINKAKIIHHDKYNYSKVKYIKSNKKIIIICKIHGEFEQTPSKHLQNQGCQKCSNANFSKPQILWLSFLEKYYNINIQHALNIGEFKIKNTKYKVDGYCKENNTIYEFHGDYWHGNPKKYKQDNLNEVCKKTFKELYENTLKREKLIKSLGYNLITIWESDWIKLNNCIKKLQLNINNKK